MKTCKICGETLTIEDKFRGTCKECEVAVSKLVLLKAGKGIYSRKARLKF